VLGFLTAVRGDPLARDMLELIWNGLGFEPKSDELGRERRSCGGEAAKHSSKVGVAVPWKTPQPAPNRNGACELFSWVLKDTVLVE
jgi:hypothetical protein